MKFEASINIQDKPGLLDKCIKTELAEKDRSSFTVERDNETVRFHIEAKDATAFRATMNSILQLLAVYNKMEKL